MRLGFSAKGKYLLVAGVTFLAGLFVALTILSYFRLTYKVPERVNFVLLGQRGESNEGADLVDTIIFASLSREGIVFLSLPRDLWYEPYQAKINTIYHYGLKNGDGLKSAKEVVGEIVGQKIDYALLVDFAAFMDLVDLVGGVDVVVDRAFDDYKYPITGLENDPCGGDPLYKCRYEHVSFAIGQQHLDGELALKFVRSRYAEGDEGTDTARSLRQQKVISALKTELISKEILTSRQKLQALKEIYEKRIKSDIPQKAFPGFGFLLANKEARRQYSFVLDGWREGENGLIYHPQKHSSGQWVLLPKDPSFRQIHQYVDCLLSQSQKSLCLPAQRPLAPVF